MSNGTSMSGKDLLWRIKRSGDSDYLLVACRVDMTFTLTRNVTPEETKCGVSKAFGPLDGNATINGEARFDIDPGDNAISYNELQTLLVNDTAFSSRISDTNNNVYIEGDSKLAQLELTSDATGASVKFSANLEFTDPASLDFTPTT